MSSAVAVDSKWLGGGQQLDDRAYRGGGDWVGASGKGGGGGHDGVRIRQDLWMVGVARREMRP